MAAHRRRTGAVALLLLAVAAAGAGPAGEREAPRAAEAARLAAHSLLIAIAAAGTRLVAVGDRGVIVYSDDQGGSWLQASAVPTQALLTGVCFFDREHGLAVGHDEVILASADAGRSWQLKHYAPAAQGPLLDVWCGSAGHAIAVGAYSEYFESRGAGVSWSERKFVAAPPPAATPATPHAPAAGDADAGGGGFHLNRIVAGAGERLYIAAEAGHLYRSDDLGASWRELASPYAGSYFGLLALPGEALLAFGLRGNLYRSEDGGASWRKLDTATLAMLDGGTRLGERTVVLVGLAGVVLVSEDAGHSFALLQQGDYAGLAGAAASGAAGFAAVGESGARVIALPQAAPR
jgi:photosystem II stability/assembly factor-like uncharacterized protein